VPEPIRANRTRDAFDVFFDEAMPTVFGYALRLTGGNQQEAWDLTQDAWLRIVSDINHGTAARPSVGLLITVVRSRFIDQLRRSKRLPTKLALVWPVERTIDDLEPSDVVAALDQLRPEHRAVLMMAYVDDLHVDEVAHVLGVSRSTTYSLMERARNELRAVIGDDHA
jgi:RNA polymerase sigma-70 factor (ECF subfamily)